MCTERAGVYVIEHVPTGRRYVGSTSNLSKRWSRHRQELRDGIHRNAHLQATWTRDGEAAFAWRVLAVTEPSERIALEQRAIDLWNLTDPERGFNRASVAGVSYGGGAWERTPGWKDQQAVSQRQVQARRRLQVGDICPNGHTVDGTYVRRRKGRTGRVNVSLRCQDCARKEASDRQRTERGIPADWPKGKHFHRRDRRR